MVPRVTRWRFRLSPGGRLYKGLSDSSFREPTSKCVKTGENGKEVGRAKDGKGGENIDHVSLRQIFRIGCKFGKFERGFLFHLLSPRGLGLALLLSFLRHLLPVAVSCPPVACVRSLRLAVTWSEFTNAQLTARSFVSQMWEQDCWSNI